ARKRRGRQLGAHELPDDEAPLHRPERTSERADRARDRRAQLVADEKFRPQSSAGRIEHHRRKSRRCNYSTRWCEEGDLNPHSFRNQILSLARLPVPPSSRALILSIYSLPALASTSRVATA